MYMNDEEGLLGVRYNSRFSIDMNEIQRAALSSLHKYLRDEIETNWIAEDLWRCNIINDEQKRYYEGNDLPSTRAESLLSHLPDNCAMADFLEILRMGQNHVAEMIENELTRLSTLPARVYLNRPSYSSRSFIRYTVVASNLQTRVFNLDNTLQNTIPTIVLLKTMPENNHGHWDNIFALVDASLGKKRTELSLEPINQSSLLGHMNDVMLETSFPLQAMMIFESRRAEALALNGQLAEALVEAMKSVQTIDLEEPCRHNGKLIYTLINILIENYFENNDPRLKSMIRNWIKDGYSQFDKEPIGTQKLWKRMYLVKEAFLHLRMDVSSKDVEGEITEEDTCRARRCLDKVRLEFWEEIDKRREMLYFRAEAKYALLLRDYTKSKMFLKKGFRISKDKFEEETVFRVLLQEVSQFLDRCPPQHEGLIPLSIQEINES